VIPCTTAPIAVTAPTAEPRSGTVVEVKHHIAVLEQFHVLQGVVAMQVEGASPGAPAQSEGERTVLGQPVLSVDPCGVSGHDADANALVLGLHGEGDGQRDDGGDAP
ncbi:MAG: hypothetical protein ACK56I_22805, partial [bacterium]